MRYGFDLMNSQDSEIGLPLVEPKYGVMIGAETMGHPCSAGGLMEEAAQRAPIHRRSRVDSKPDDPARVLIHHNKDPMRLESKGLTPEEINAPETVFHMPNERKP
jgi:hypothetical protein